MPTKEGLHLCTMAAALNNHVKEMFCDEPLPPPPARPSPPPARPAANSQEQNTQHSTSSVEVKDVVCGAENVQVPECYTSKAAKDRHLKNAHPDKNPTCVQKAHVTTQKINNTKFCDQKEDLSNDPLLLLTNGEQDDILKNKAASKPAPRSIWSKIKALLQFKKSIKPLAVPDKTLVGETVTEQPLDAATETPTFSEAHMRAQLALFLLVNLATRSPTLITSYMDNGATVLYNWSSLDGSSSVELYWNNIANQHNVLKTLEVDDNATDTDKQFQKWARLANLSQDNNSHQAGFVSAILEKFVTVFNAVTTVIPGQDQVKTTKADFASIYAQLSRMWDSSYAELVKTTAFACAYAAIQSQIMPQDDAVDNFDAYASTIGKLYAQLIWLYYKPFCEGNMCPAGITDAAEIVKHVQARWNDDNKSMLSSKLLTMRIKLIETDKFFLPALQEFVERAALRNLANEHAAKLSHTVKYAQLLLYVIVQLHALAPRHVNREANSENVAAISLDHSNKQSVNTSWIDLASANKVLIDLQTHAYTAEELELKNNDFSQAMQDTRFVNTWSAQYKNLNEAQLLAKTNTLLSRFLDVFNLTTKVINGKTNKSFQDAYNQLASLMSGEYSKDYLESVKTTAFVCAHYALHDTIRTAKPYAEAYVNIVKEWYKDACPSKTKNCNDFYAQEYKLWNNPSSDSSMEQRIKNEQKRIQRKLLYIRYAMLSLDAQLAVDSKNKTDKTLVDKTGKAVSFAIKTIDAQLKKLSQEQLKDALRGGALTGGHPSTDFSHIINDVLRRYARFVRLTTTRNEPTLADFYWHVRYPESIFQYRKKLLTNAELPSQGQALAQARDQARDQALNDKEVLTQWMRLQNKPARATASSELYNEYENDNTDSSDDEEEEQEEAQSMSSFAPVMQQLAQVFEMSSPKNVQNNVCWAR